MTKETLRQELHRLVDSVKTKRDMETSKIWLKQMVESKGTDLWDELTDDQKADVDEGIAQADKGDLHSYKEVKDLIKKRYKL